MRQHSALDALPGGNASRLGLAPELRRSGPAPAGLLLRGAFLGLAVYFFGHLDARRDTKCSTAILDRPLIAMALLRAGHQVAKRGGRVFRFGGELSPQHIAEHSVRHPTALMPPKRPIEHGVNISPHPMPTRPRRVSVLHRGTALIFLRPSLAIGRRRFGRRNRPDVKLGKCEEGHIYCYTANRVRRRIATSAPLRRGFSSVGRNFRSGPMLHP